MENLKVAAAQFENASGDKVYNLSVIEEMVSKASALGVEVIAFHECSVTGYSFARKLSRGEMLALSEVIPNGPSVTALIEMAKKYKITILAGLFEKDEHENMFKAYVCVDETGLIAKHRKLHPFINSNLLPGTSYTIFEIKGWKCGILICYDNNVIENVRATTLLGAEIIFMPHVTMCTPSPRPGAGFVDAELWKEKDKNAALLRSEFDGDKGRNWLMKWLPARAYDNGIYAIFCNPIGMDDDQLKNGCSMILNPFGEIVAECRTMENEFVVAELCKDELKTSGGFRYKKARRPELYGEILASSHTPDQQVAWLKK
ncbi:putative amidohydrolase [Pedobacter sp. W3I1]|uniref:nitrilase family protein n=1 Tax=Pedobacter sp. W3I1 TaxID=3042291 RepID=UPI002785A60F|nr:nitrilase family protein [Pedobacter sp. W3I1]MDQ0640542.1 putative amidohydrolase [Pedobacter sp. W3I1]